jgi:catechol 2,3-dioxygenase-like lactoylglutathione lyase family enzyme
MGANEKMSSMGQPVPELPVADVERAQQHYRDVLGFEIGWLYPGKEIWGGVAREGGDILSEEDAVVRSGRALGVCRRYRCVVPGTESVRCEHRGSAGNKALGITAIHRTRPGREPFLFSP